MRPAAADSPAPLHDFALASPNGQYLFVMLVRADDQSAYNQRGRVIEDAALCRTYPASGLYPTDGSTTPLWTVAWNAGALDLANDGHHLIRYGPWPLHHHYAEVALFFYRDGQELQRYRVRDLVATPARLPHSVSHYHWIDAHLFDAATGRLILITHTRERYVFDVTGTLREGSVPPQPLLPAYLRELGMLGVVLGVGLSILALHRRGKRLSTA